MCDRFYANLDSDEPVAEVAARYGLPDRVPAPDGVTVSNVYCFGRDDEAGNSGVVLGVAVEDRSRGGVWVILSDKANELSEADWQVVLSDHGWIGAARTRYGYSTRSGDAVELWSEVARQRRSGS